tara:strand:+ start:3250 stop:4113 length:864 start_codon:yes stop_codon:yes gene_type:complete
MSSAVKIYADPPECDSLRELLLYFCDQGIGLRTSGSDRFPRWTDILLEGALAATGTEVDRRSIQAWLSGATIPKGDKLRALASLASSQKFEREKWSAALLKLRRKAIDERKREKSVSQIEVRPDDARRAKTDFVFRMVPVRARFMLFAGIFAFSALIVTLGFSKRLGLVTEPVATDIEFCAEDTFDKTLQRCKNPTHAFTDGLSTLLVTLDLSGVPTGEKFTRRWYLNGELVHQKTSFNDEAWPGYTYWHWPTGFRNGLYTLQIVYEDKTSTAQFRVGEDDGELVFR